jgi:hypothetical protein
MKPILFSTPMIRAILAGEKTVTRRVIKPQPEGGKIAKVLDGGMRGFWGVTEVGHIVEPEDIRITPYEVGEILWVRETWGDYDGESAYITYRADYPDGAKTYEWPELDEFGEKIICDLPKWRPSIFMPKEACRIFLRVIGVRAERLQELSWDDAIKEGVPRRTEYIVLWNHLNGKRGFGWDRNPWVWVIEFERCEKSEDTQ